MINLMKFMKIQTIMPMMITKNIRIMIMKMNTNHIMTTVTMTNIPMNSMMITASMMKNLRLITNILTKTILMIFTTPMKRKAMNKYIYEK